MIYFLYLLLGIGAGFTSGFFGIGGGSIIVPMLMLFGFDIKQAVGISVMQMVFTSIFGSFLNYKHGTLRLSDGIILGVGGALGAFSSGFIIKIIPENILILTFGALLLFSIYRFFRAPIIPNGEEKTTNLLYFLLGICAGAVSISLGIGGAIFLVPIMVGFLNVDIKKAVSMGLFFVIFSSLSGFISQSINGLVNYKIGLIIGISSLIGTYFGAKLSHKIDKRLQKKLLLILYIIMLVIIIFELIENFVLE